MEDLLQIYRISEEFNRKLEENKNEFLQKVRIMLHGPSIVQAAASAAAVSDQQLLGASPQQTKKRIKRLTSLNEDEEPIKVEMNESNTGTSASNTKILEQVEVMEQDEQEPIVPVPTPRQAQPQAQKPTTPEIEERPPSAPVEEHEFLRPQRAPRKNLKEPSLIKKIRRPSNENSVLVPKIKQEHEQRQSQMLNASTASTRSKQSNASNKSSDASLLLVPEKAPSIVELNSDVKLDVDIKEKLVVKPKKRSDESISSSCDDRQLRVMVKREKLSMEKVKATEKPTQQPEPVNADNDMTMEAAQTMPQPKQAVVKTEPTSKDETTLHSNTINTTSSTTSTSTVTHTKKGKKKKDVVHRPIKVERFSDIEAKPSPISSRTRHGSVGRAQRPASIYEDALGQPAVASEDMHVHEQTDTPPSRVSQVPQEVIAATASASSPAAAPNEANNTPTSMSIQPNATMLIGAGDATFTANPAQTTFQVAAGQTTFVMDNPNATVTIATKLSGTPECDATFNIAAQRRSNSKDNQSMVTARDTSNPAEDSLITEDESYQSPEVLLPPPAPKATALPKSGKAYKMPTRTNELFNPLVQSPVKKKVEAFEAAAVQAKPSRPKRTKENTLPKPTTSIQSSNTTPQPGKLPAPVLGRFLTPTQSSNITPNATMVHTKKLASSASKAMAFPKTSSSTLKASSASAKATLSRENSGDDFRRGIHLLAEDRKKMREQKHLQAAQQREAKEKERAERMAKLAKEREEKRLKKQAELDQKKKEMEEIQRKLKHQEEQEQLKLAQMQSAKSKAIQDQERDLLQQMKPPKSKQHLQPAAKLRSKYTFEMLHEDDSTDEEDKVTYKRPAPPSWSRSTVRGPAIHMQQSWPTDIIDSFFSVQPMTPDLKLIFPNIDDRHLKRNSSAFWTTPPRYSDLPKY